MSISIPIETFLYQHFNFYINISQIFSSCVITSGPWDVLRLLGVLNYFDEEDDEDFGSELGIHSSTHTYILKTDGVSIRIVAPPVAPVKSRFGTVENQTEDLFLISATFMGQMVEEFLHFTVTNGDEKVSLFYHHNYSIS